MAEFRNLDFGPGIVQKHGYGLAIEPRMTMPVHRCIFIRGMASMSVRMVVQVHLLGHSAGSLSGIGQRREGHRQHDADDKNSSGQGAMPGSHQLIPFARCSSRTYAVMAITSARVTPSTGGMFPKSQWCALTPFWAASRNAASAWWLGS